MTTGHDAVLPCINSFRQSPGERSVGKYGTCLVLMSCIMQGVLQPHELEILVATSHKPICTSKARPKCAQFHINFASVPYITQRVLQPHALDSMHSIMFDCPVLTAAYSILVTGPKHLATMPCTSIYAMHDAGSATASRTGHTATHVTQAQRHP